MKRSRRGAALLLTLGYLAVVSVFVSVYLSGVHRSFEAGRQAERTAIARAYAEAGLNHAIANLRLDPAYAGAETLPIADGAVEIHVEKIGAGWRVYSIGTGVSGPLTWSQHLRAEISGEGKIRSWEWERGQ